MTEENKKNLLSLAELAGVDRKAIEHMMSFAGENDPKYWAYFNIGMHSSKKRLWVFDLKEVSFSTYHVVHGKGSDVDYDGIAEKFSNVPNSLCSSLGVYKTAETYEMSGHGRALRLDGLEETNSKARERGIVFHGVSYAGDVFVKANGKCGRSWGCPAVDENIVQGLIDKLKGGSLLYIHKGQKQ